MKQENLEGMEPVKIDELTELAEEYEEKRDQRIKLLAKEIELKEELIAMMESYGLQTYRDGDLLITKTSKVGVKCKRGNSDGKEEES